MSCPHASALRGSLLPPGSLRVPRLCPGWTQASWQLLPAQDSSADGFLGSKSTKGVGSSPTASPGCSVCSHTRFRPRAGRDPSNPFHLQSPQRAAHEKINPQNQHTSPSSNISCKPTLLCFPSPNRPGPPLLSFPPKPMSPALEDKSPEVQTHLRIREHPLPGDRAKASSRCPQSSSWGGQREESPCADCAEAAEQSWSTRDSSTDREQPWKHSPRTRTAYSSPPKCTNLVKHCPGASLLTMVYWTSTRILVSCYIIVRKNKGLWFGAEKLLETKYTIHLNSICSISHSSGQLNASLSHFSMSSILILPI